MQYAFLIFFSFFPRNISIFRDKSRIISKEFRATIRHFLRRYIIFSPSLLFLFLHARIKRDGHNGREKRRAVSNDSNTIITRKMALSRKGGEITIRAKNLDNAITRLTTLTNQPVGKRVSFERPSKRLQLIASHISIFRSFCPRLAPTHKSSLRRCTKVMPANHVRVHRAIYFSQSVATRKKTERERGENKIKHRIPSFLRLVVETNP